VAPAPLVGGIGWLFKVQNGVNDSGMSVGATV